MPASPTQNLWHKTPASLTPRPTWRDARPGPAYRFYGGGTDRLHVAGDLLRVSPRPAYAVLFVSGAAVIVLFVAVAFLAIPDPGHRVLFGVFGPILCAILVAAMAVFLAHHAKLGDYLVVDRAARLVRLPRLGREFPYADIVAFQSITGRSEASADPETDLNLLVRDPATGDTVRYHVLAGPRRAHLKQLVEFSGLPMQDLTRGYRGRRDTDRDSAAP
ncbi:MAG TPA: hypothetical protein VEA69_16100 [Tepidisphaeraceae bacterium]|nr:hypothetical protein [Tepidisphaeraceae bacterium]